MTTSSSGAFNFRRFVQKYGIYIVFVFICVVMSFLSDVFAISMNIRNILMQVSINGILAIGMTFVIITGGILYNDGMPIPNLSDDFLFIGQGRCLGLPMSVVIYLALMLVSWIILRYSRFSRYIYAVGGNEKSARASGVNTNFIYFAVYAISGLCAGIASLILTARTTSALTQAGNGYELAAIADAVVVGTSLSGGSGSISGTLVGVLIIGVLNNGLDLLGVSSYWYQIIKGIVIEPLIPAGGIDGISDAIRAVSRNEMVLSVRQDAFTQSQGAMDVALRHLIGPDYKPMSKCWEMYPQMPWGDGTAKLYSVPWTIVTSANAAEFLDEER